MSILYQYLNQILLDFESEWQPNVLTAYSHGAADRWLKVQD